MMVSFAMSEDVNKLRSPTLSHHSRVVSQPEKRLAGLGADDSG